jgi:hypothetical protein
MPPIAQSMLSIPCSAASISATVETMPITIGIARPGSSLRFSSPTRILSSTKAIITTAVVWNAMVSTMSVKPQVQLMLSNRLIL